MQIKRDKKDKTIDIHFNGESGVYALISFGRQDFGKYGGIYLSLSEEIATEIAEKILKKVKK